MGATPSSPKKCTCNLACPVDHKAIALSFKENTVEEYERLKKECLQDGRLYEDPDFPAENSSFIRSFESDEEGRFNSFLQDLKWKRPKDICENPKFFLEGPSRFDVNQGKLNDCWFVASASILASNTDILQQVLPKGQCFNENYAGIFLFRFWQYGRWVSVIVDDRLPVRETKNKFKLISMQSSQDNEFWSALLEKAYAKLYGSYRALEFGFITTALEDLTGGLSESFSMSKYTNKELFRRMVQAKKHGSLMGCSTGFKSKETENKYGIGRNHAYSITQVKYIKIQTSEGIEKKRMVRVRNPWGMSEWTGAWNDESSEWYNVSEEVKEKLDLKVRDDGEFWMEIKDFCKHFDGVGFTHLNKAGDIDPYSDIKWEMSQFQGSWEEEVSAGGCIDFADSFHTNPQYRLTLHECDDIDEDDDDGDDDGEEESRAHEGHKCTVIVSLMKKYQRRAGGGGMPFGFSIFKTPDSDDTTARYDAAFFENAQRVALAPFNYDPKRTYTKRFQIPPGNYCIVPALAFSGYDGEFFLRIYTEKQHTAKANEIV